MNTQKYIINMAQKIFGNITREIFNTHHFINLPISKTTMVVIMINRN